jgi:hypothetical protein
MCRPGRFVEDIVFSKPAGRRMSLRKANQLALSGFCAFYIGLMGILMAINVPVISGFRRPVLLVLGAIALAGVALMLIGRMTKVNESEGF